MRHGDVSPVIQRDRRLANGEQLLDHQQERSGVLRLRGDVPRRVIGVHRQPRIDGGKPSVGAIIPRHRRAFKIAAAPHARLIHGLRVSIFFRRNVAVVHADFVAVIHGRRAAQRQQQQLREAGVFLPGAFRRANPILIMIAKHPIRPRAFGQCVFIRGREAADRFRRERAIHQPEIEGQMAFVQPLAVIFHQFRVRQINFANQDALVVFVEQCPHFADNRVNFGLIARAVMPRGFRHRQGGRPVGIGRFVAELRVFDHHPDHIHAETVHAAIEPETQRVQHRHDDFGMAPV